MYGVGFLGVSVEIVICVFKFVLGGLELVLQADLGAVVCLSFLVETLGLSVKKFSQFGILSLESVDLALQVSLNSIQFFILALQVKVAKIEIVFELLCLNLVVIDLSLKLSLGSDDLSLKVLSDLCLFLGDGFQLVIPAVDDILQSADFSLQEFHLVIVGILEKRKLRILDSFQLISQVAHLNISDSLGFEDLVLEILIFFLEDFDGILIVVLDLEILCQDLFDFCIFGVDDLLEFGVFIVKSLDLVQVLFLQVFQLRVVSIIELSLK